MSDPDLFSAPRARTTDPLTSHAAAASMKQHARAQLEQLLHHLGTCGATGATANECDLAFGWDAATAGRRLSELDKVLGWAQPALHLSDHSRVTRPTSRGRAATVYVLTQPGRAMRTLLLEYQRDVRPVTEG